MTELHSITNEQDIFNQRKGMMKTNNLYVNTDFETFSKKLILTSKRIRNLDFFNIGFASVTMLAITILGAMSMHLGIAIGILSAAELFRNLSIILAIKLYLKKQKTKYATLRDLSSQYKNQFFYIYSKNY